MGGRPVKAGVAFIIKELHRPGLKTAGGSRVKYEGAGKEPDEAIIIMNGLKTEWQVVEKNEANS